MSPDWLTVTDGFDAADCVTAARLSADACVMDAVEPAELLCVIDAVLNAAVCVMDAPLP